MQRLLLILFFLLLTLSVQAKPGYFEPWGKDADLALPAKNQERPKLSLFAQGAEKIIRFHQQVLSPVDGPRSHFRPSSSEYMRLAIRKHGFIKGYFQGCDRLLRENSDPWVYRQVQVERGMIFKWDPPK